MKLRFSYPLYVDNKRTAVRLHTEDGEPYASLSINVPGAILAPNEFVLKHYSENAPFAEQAAAHFYETGKSIGVAEFVTCRVLAIPLMKPTEFEFVESFGVTDAPDCCESCRGFGFILSYVSALGGNSIERCDECSILANDDEAASECYRLATSREVPK